MLRKIINNIYILYFLITFNTSIKHQSIKIYPIKVIQRTIVKNRTFYAPLLKVYQIFFNCKIITH